MWELHGSDLRRRPPHLGVLLTFSACGPGGPGAPALPGNPGGPCINKGAGEDESGAWGGALLPSSTWVCFTVVNAMHSDFLETPPRSITAGWPAGPGPTQEALPSRSWLLESGLATQAVPPVPLPSPPQAHPRPAWPGQAYPSQTGSHQTELALCLHSPVGRESLAGLEIPRGRSEGQFAEPPTPSRLAAQMERVTG